MSSYVNTKESRGVGAIAAADHRPRSKIIARPKPGYAGVPVKVGTRGKIIRPVAHKQATVVRTPHGPRIVKLKSRPEVYPSAGYIRSGDQQALGALTVAGAQLYQSTQPTTTTVLSPTTSKLTTISKTSEPSRCSDGYVYKAGYYRTDSTGKQVWVNGGCVKIAPEPIPTPSPLDRLKDLTITKETAPVTTTTVVTTKDEVVVTRDEAPTTSKEGRTTTKVISATNQPKTTTTETGEIVTTVDIQDPSTGEVIIPRGSLVSQEEADMITPPRQTFVDENGNDVIVPDIRPSGFMGTRIPTIAVIAGAGILGYLLLKRRG